ncbi:hypothetical protein GQ43DRAFT_438708, partial [Delitschia confertaspora ATCC 74209]
MTSRRVPLANLQNATNSPLRVANVGGKRQRSHASEQRDLPYGQPPPAKKQIVEVDDAEARRNGLQRRSGAPPTSLQKRLEAAREVKQVPKQLEKSQRTAETQNLETIRQWQRHYKKMFPQFVFYFESIPEDMRSKVSRQLHTLGSKEVKFFSREVTHVVTTRPIPVEIDTSSGQSSSTTQPANLPRTINPAAVEKSKSVFDAALGRGSNGDILHKAKEFGMKIWSAEKLQRILHTMFNTDTGEQPAEYSTVRRGSAATQAKAGRQADLQKLLQNEKLNGPADRDFAAPTQEMVQLRGFYIYIHDMDEVTRPVMVREYPKTAVKEEGKWPQFRVTGPGKCPFIEDNSHGRRVQQEEKARAEKAAAAPRTRAATAQANRTVDRPALGENNNLAKCATTVQDVQQENVKPLDPPKTNGAKPAAIDSMPPMFGSAQASIRAMPRFAGGEPVASGIQPSNVTSAIQSNMISSTAAAPGARAGNSRTVDALKRKVLERNNSGHSVMNDMRAALNQEAGPPSRAAKRKAQETLGMIQENMSAEEQDRRSRKTVIVRRRKAAEKELKPGYCENCREKFNDFDEHTFSRKHRKFATTRENWRELDELLATLVR